MAEDNKEAKKEGPEEQVLAEPVKIKDLLLITIYSLEGKAWAYLGLVAHPETKKPKKDITEAKLAIDSMTSIYDMIKDALNDEERRDFDTRLANLKLNFVMDQSETK